jgi:hypothetical protein
MARSRLTGHRHSRSSPAIGHCQLECWISEGRLESNSKPSLRERGKVLTKKRILWGVFVFAEPTADKNASPLR